MNPNVMVSGSGLPPSPSASVSPGTISTSRPARMLVEIVPGDTLADGLGGNPDPETITFGFIQQFVDRIVTVSEADLAAAIVGLVESEHLIAEGAGAAATGALVGRRAEGARRAGALHV